MTAGLLMRNTAKCLLRALAVVAIMAPHLASADWLIVPGQRAGPIAPGVSEERLVKLLGAKHVKRAMLPDGEGGELPVTVVFDGDRSRRATILWGDAEKRTSPRAFLIRDEGSKWRTAQGITVGTSLATLRRLNGRPLLLTGFAWDYGGTILDNNGGRLAAIGTEGPSGLVGRTLILRVDPPLARHELPAYAKVLGEKDFSSDDPAMKALDPRVFEVMIEFATP